MKNTIVIFIVSMLVLTGCTASMDREAKSWQSNMSGGLNRVVTVYDYNGNAIKEYKGKIDVEDSPSNDKVLFDLDGKRTIIHGGIVIIDEVE